MTVAELSATMSSKELDQWKIYYELEPFGQERDNWHMAQLAALYARAHSKKTISYSEFMYRSVEEIRMKKERETAATLDALAAMAKPKTDT